MEINLADWIELNGELTAIEQAIADGVESVEMDDRKVHPLEKRDIIVKKLLVFMYLFGARSDRLDEIIREEPEYETFLNHIEEADKKNALGEKSSQRDGHEPDGGGGVLSWYGQKSPLSKIGNQGREGDVVSDRRG